MRRARVTLILVFRLISIHAPREGCDSLATSATSGGMSFQSTHPVRGATASNHASRSASSRFQSTHPVRGATLTLRALYCVLGFQSTHPVRGATIVRIMLFKIRIISIHAPREGCDVSSSIIFLSYIFQSTHPVRGATARMDFISQNMDTPPIPRHQLYRTIHPHFPRYANPLNRYASRSLTLELSNDKKNTHRPQKP